MINRAEFERQAKELGAKTSWSEAQQYYEQRQEFHNKQLRPFMDELAKKAGDYDAIGFLDRDARPFWHASDHSPALAAKPRYLLGVSRDVIPAEFRGNYGWRIRESDYDTFARKTRAVFDGIRAGTGKRKAEEIYKYIQGTGLLAHKHILLVDTAYTGCDMAFVKHLIESRHPDKTVDIYLHTTVVRSVVPAFKHVEKEHPELQFEFGPQSHITGPVKGYETSGGKVVPVYGPPKTPEHVPEHKLKYWIDQRVIEDVMAQPTAKTSS